MPEIFNVEHVDAAIELAERFRREGKYNWFRGQINVSWLPHSSLFRIYRTQDQEKEAHAKRRIARFYEWAAVTGGIKEMVENEHNFFAIAQHYGIPTHYIDFTTAPGVAGFFASDGVDIPAGQESCIFCLDTKDMSDLFDTLQKAKVRDLPIESVEINVANLWRLETQKGVFLYCPWNWDVDYPMDRIIFPYEGYPSYPTRSVIYPDRRSHLEILLENYFAGEADAYSAEAFHELLRGMKNPDGQPIPVVSMDPDLVVESVLRSIPSDHPSWSAASSPAWRELRPERYAAARGHRVSLTINPSDSPKEVAVRVATGVRRAIVDNSSIRQTAAEWNIEYPRGEPAEKFDRQKTAQLCWLWDGLRSLPASDEQLASAMGACTGLMLTDYANLEPDKQQEIASEFFGSTIRVGFSAADGSGAFAYVSTEELIAAIRPDVRDIIVPDYLNRSEDLHFLLQAIKSPQKLFVFERFASVFFRQIVPTQLALPYRQGVFFSPARLYMFGLY